MYPLTQLLHKDIEFRWTEDTKSTFAKLKKALTSAPVLALPEFDQPFTVETDASGVGIGVVLLQKGHPIAYISKAMGPKYQLLSAYEKEFYAILFAVKKWQHYFLGQHFIIKTDQKALKHLLEQPPTTLMQNWGLEKLMGLDFSIEYKKRKENVVADALSGQKQGSIAAIFQVTSQLLMKATDS